MTTGGGALPKYGGGAAPTERTQKSTVEIALVGLKATENLLHLCNPPKREQGRRPRTAGGKETGKPTVADRHGTGAKSSAGAEIVIEAKKESVSKSEAEKGSAAGGRRARGTGRRRESDTEIKMQRKGEIGKETETEPEILTGGIMTATEEETATVSGNERETEKRDATDPEARSGTGTETETETETAGKTGAEIETETVTEIGTGTESGTETEIGTGTGKKTKRGIVMMGAEAKKSERRKKTNMVHPRRVKNMQKMQKACPLRNEHYIKDFGDC